MEQFLNLTMRQVVAFIKNIQSSRVDHYEFLAKLQGHKLETNFEKEASSSLSVEQEQQAEQYLKSLNEKLRGANGPK